MSKVILDAKAIIKEFPELKDFVPNGSDDFDRIAVVLGSRNPNHVWPVLNGLARGTTRAPSPKLARLFG